MQYNMFVVSYIDMYIDMYTYYYIVSFLNEEYNIATSRLILIPDFRHREEYVFRLFFIYLFFLEDSNHNLPITIIS